MRLRMLISHSFAGQCTPALPDTWFKRAWAPSMRAMTSSSTRFGNRRIAAVADQLLAMLLELLEQVGLQVGARADVHDLEDRRERVMVIDRGVPLDELAEPVEQVLEPKHRPDALVEGIFVQDQGEIRIRSARRKPPRAAQRWRRLFHSDSYPSRRLRSSGRGRGFAPERHRPRASSSATAMPSLWMTASAAARGAPRGSPAAR